MNTDTPRTDAETRYFIDEEPHNDHSHVSAGFARVLERELTELRDWKEQALAVEREWDVQEVGRLLNLPLGSSIRAGIEPGIRRLREALEAADECLALIEDAGHGAMPENVTVARRIVREALTGSRRTLADPPRTTHASGAD